MKISILILALLTIISSKAQDIRDSLQGEYIGIRNHYKFGGIQEYSVPDTLYVYKATEAGKIHIRYEPYKTEQEYLDYETIYPQNLYTLEIDTSFQSGNYSYYQIGEFKSRFSIYLYDHVRNGGGVADAYLCEKNNDISIGIYEDTLGGNKIFPNPTSNVINIYGVQIGSLKLFNSKGEIVLKTENLSTIDISELSVGIYYLSINNSIHKIVKR